MTTEELIEAYHEGNLDWREAYEFELRLEQDASLQEDYRIYLATIAALRMPIPQVKREQLIPPIVIHEESTGGTPVTPMPTPLRIVPIWRIVRDVMTIAAMLACIYFGYKLIWPPQTVDSISTEVAELETLRDLKTIRGYAANAERDKKALALLESSKLDSLRQHLALHKSNYVRFTLALLLMQGNGTRVEKSQVMEALNLLKQIDTRSVLYYEAQWQTAKCKFALGQEKEAESILQKLANNQKAGKVQQWAQNQLQNAFKID